jgi:tetratricopeptide (TPR) repeat protein
MKNSELIKIIFLTMCIIVFSNAQSQTGSVETSGLDKYAELIENDIAELSYKINSKENQPDPELYNKRGMLFFATRKYENAVKDFETVINLNSSRLSDAYFYKALSNFLLGNINCDDFKKAKDLGFVADWEKFKTLCANLK